MKTSMSRFQIHDDLTAPEGSVPVLRGRARPRRPAAELPRRARRLAGGAARLRALPLGAAPRQADAARRSSGSRSPSPSTTAPSRASRLHSRTARAAGLGLDEVALAREFDSKRPARGGAAALPAAAARGAAAEPPMHLHEEAREAGWDDEQILEAIAAIVAGELRRDGERRRRGAGRRLGRGVAGPAGGVSSTPVMCARERHSSAAPTPARRAGTLLSALPRGGRAGRPALDRRDPARADGRRRCASRRSPQAVPELSDRLLSERMKELEAPRDRRAHGRSRARRCASSTALSQMGRELEPALSELQRLGQPLAGRSGCRSAPEPRRDRAGPG